MRTRDRFASLWLVGQCMSAAVASFVACLGAEWEVARQSGLLISVRLGFSCLSLALLWWWPLGALLAPIICRSLSE